MRHPAFTSGNQDCLMVARMVSGPSPFKAPARLPGESQLQQPQTGLAEELRAPSQALGARLSSIHRQLEEQKARGQDGYAMQC